ncbi:MAG: DUF2785 domain-containing protein [Specibacter sp.]
MSEPTATLSGLEIGGLFEDLASADPAVRDGESLGRLCGLVDTGALPQQQINMLGSLLVDRFSHPRVEARSFAALVLARIVLSGPSEPEWFLRFATWYANEREVCGHDPVRGWLHAVAHGADALAAFGWAWDGSPRAVLDLAAQRMLNPEPIVWRDQEDDRLGYAIAVTLSNPQLTLADALEWLEPIRQTFLRGQPGPVPAFASNSIRTLRVVCLLTRGEVSYEGRVVGIRHASAVERTILEVLHIASPWMWNLKSQT